MINIYYTVLNEDFIKNSEIYSNQIPSYIANRINHYKFAFHRNLKLLGKILLLKALESEAYKNKLNEIKFNKYGKPYFECGPHFNISYTENIAICVLSKLPIGIDIEKIKPLELEFYKDILNCEDIIFLNKFKKSKQVILKFPQKINDLHEAFFDIWTKKEAIVKAEGKGLFIPLKYIFLKFDDIEYGYINHNSNHNRDINFSKWYLKKVNLTDSVILNIAYRDKIHFQMSKINF